MKEIIKRKVRKVLDSFEDIYVEQSGELFNEREGHDFASHLMNLGLLVDCIFPPDTTSEQERIAEAYFKDKNDYEFNSLLADYMIKIGKIAAGKDQDHEVSVAELSDSLRPIVIAIAYAIFKQESVAAILDDEKLSYRYCRGSSFNW